MLTAQQPTRPAISIDHDTHKAAKIRAAQLGITMKDAADQAFELWLARDSRKQESKFAKK